MKVYFGPIAIAAVALAGCQSSQSIVSGPTMVQPPYPVAVAERTPGSLYRPETFANIYQDTPLAHKIGDKIKIEIAETSTASSDSNTKFSRSNSVQTKGPGTSNDKTNTLLKGVLNLDAEASGSDDFDGQGKTDNTNSLTGTMSATVINVLANGNLVVAGERSIAFNGQVNTLRFSGVVNKNDLKKDNVVASEDVMDAHIEYAGKGLVSDSSSKTWLQKLLSNSLLVW